MQFVYVVTFEFQSNEPVSICSIWTEENLANSEAVRLIEKHKREYKFKKYFVEKVELNKSIDGCAI
ncbi:MAG: hypothetical protein LH614_12735 [Pyrinomonadaceae bacterium]|nr:hypothetical protein [Pyrinomonadaceae bacterium]